MVEIEYVLHTNDGSWYLIWLDECLLTKKFTRIIQIAGKERQYTYEISNYKL